MKLKFKSTKLHIILAVVWLLLMIPTFVWWKESILWVGFMSCYALFIGHVSSYEAAASAGVDAETHAKLNALADGMADLMDAVMILLLDKEEGREEAAQKLLHDRTELLSVVGIETDD